MHAMPALEELLTSRHSCRGFRPDPVPRSTLARIFAAAGKTASWCNSQPWQLIVTSGAATRAFAVALRRHVEREKAADGPGSRPDFAFPHAYTGVYAERRRETAMRLYDSVGIARGDRVASARQTMENFDLFGAPHAIIITTPADLGIYGAIDCGGFVATVQLAAQACGVAVIAQAALAAYPDFVRGHFDIAADRRVVVGMSMGFEATDHPANNFRTGRCPHEEFVRWIDTTPAARSAP